MKGNLESDYKSIECREIAPHCDHLNKKGQYRTAGTLLIVFVIAALATTTHTGVPSWTARHSNGAGNVCSYAQNDGFVALAEQIIELDAELLAPVLNEDAPVSREVAGLYTEWMGQHMDVLGERTLLELTLPGTHDSAAYHFAGKKLFNVDRAVQEIVKAAQLLHLPIEHVIVQWSRAQDRTIYDQLMAGVRYFDLRAVWDGADWKTFHGITGVAMQQVLDDVAQFMGKYVQELVVLEVMVYPGVQGGDLCTLAKLFADRFAKLLIPNTGDFAKLRIKDLVARGQRLLCVSNLATVSASQFWGKSAVHNTFADSPSLNTMKSYNEARASEATAWPHTDSLYKMSWTLTPSAQTIVSGFLPGSRPRDLHTLALTANPELQAFVTQLAGQHKRPGHILIVDYWEQHSEVVSAAVQLSTAADK